jgi:uncharacterized repeat protein (TIGR03803 family)
MNRGLHCVGLLAVMLVLVGSLAAQTEQVLYSFTGAADGDNPLSSLTMDAAGNLYGTTFVGGTINAGVVYELSPDGNGGWTQTVIYTFTGGADGANPYYADVIFDKAGNLYGTTVGGGPNNLGVVFELSPNGNGGWNEAVLHSFAGGIDGQNPYSGLVLDPFGNLYGTTYGGGAYGVGTVFQLRRGSGAKWIESVIHTFDVKTGSSPAGGLVFDNKGDLFGTTQGGGAYNVGVVYVLQYLGKNKWTPRVIHNFTGGDDGGYPYAERLIFDKAGNLYGTTEGGGVNSVGVVFKLFQSSKGWKEQVLYPFNGAVESNPFAGVVMDGAGNLYGTCANGNSTTTVGSVYKLTPSGGGKYTESDLYLFTGKDGEFPESALVRDKAGNLYGTTTVGGANRMGVVFEVSQ